MRYRLLALLLAALAFPTIAHGGAPPETAGAPPVASDAAAAAAPAQHTHRVIVRLSTPALAAYADAGVEQRTALYDQEGLLRVDSPAAEAHLDRIADEQEAFLTRLAKIVPEARVDHFIDGAGQEHPLRWSVVVNGMTLTAGLGADPQELAARVRAIPGVASAGIEGMRSVDMYDSLGIVRAIEAWDDAQVGGSDEAGRGIRVASADCGAHKDAAMLDGEGFDYPAGYPLGDTTNTNGKIIVSRTYFRSYDPPARGDEMPWPGEASSSHGVHTIGSAAGNIVEGLPENAASSEEPVRLAGVAPAAYVMSYRICYAGTYVSANSIGDSEAIAAHEDLVLDRAQVVNNSWGGGPLSVGGVADASEVALENAWKAGVFVAVSNGNSGPLPATMDHPSPLYVNVANSTKGSAFIAPGMNVIEPDGVPGNLENIPFTLAQFGPAFTEPSYGPYSYMPAIRVDEANFEGCDPWPEGTFEDKAALISRGTCSFNQKVLNAEQAGAVFAVIHNDAARGDTLTNMITEDEEVAGIHSVFIGHTAGTNMVAWHDDHPDDAAFTLDVGLQRLTHESHPNRVPPPDRVVIGSSRGPAAGNVLKPDLAAPGTAILSQGFGPGPGEQRHLQFGQASGTSMAAPHVAGAAAVLRASHPDWSIAQIKSALMGTAQYMNIYNHDGTPAQPLDMGAGRLDVAAALDPGFLAMPPSLSYGLVEQGQEALRSFTLTNLGEEQATVTLRARDTRAGFDAVTDLGGLNLIPEQVTIPAGGEATVEARWDTSAVELGDHQGYVVVTDQEHEIHLPVWVRVGSPPAGKEVLLVDHDGTDDVVGAYTETLGGAFMSYDVWNVDDQLAAGERLLPPPGDLSAYDWLLYQSGENAVTLPTRYTLELNEYLNAGGRMAIFGENAHVIFGDTSLFWDATLGASPNMIHSITGGSVITDTLLPLFSPPGSPFADVGLRLDLSGMGDGAGNQDNIHEVDFDDDTTPLLSHALTTRTFDGVVAAGKKHEPSLEVPGVAYPGRTMLYNFGLEGVNDDIPDHNPRTDLLFATKAWLADTVSVSALVDPAAANAVTYFSVTVTSSDALPTGARIDYGDGSPPGEFAIVANPDLPYNALGYHIYREPGTYTVRLEGTDSFGTVGLSELQVTIDGEVPYVSGRDRGAMLALPWLGRNADLDAENPAP